MDVTIREARPADIGAIATVAAATGQTGEWSGSDPAYVTHLLQAGHVVVAEHQGQVAGFGAARDVPTPKGTARMLCDLFVDPGCHGMGLGQAMLAVLWGGDGPRMTFSSLHAHALPLYTRYGLDAWWPLLYLQGDVGRVRMPPGWSVSGANPDRIGELERRWTGADRTAEHQMWARWPDGAGIVASLDGEAFAAGTVGGAGHEYGISHLAVAPAAGTIGGADDEQGIARDAVLAVLASLRPPGGQARACLPAPHPATRPLLGSGWRVQEFDLFMGSHFGLVDARRMVLSPALA
jgi:ribosomal protein S18 acetylase RimI-like enzyme